MLWNSLHPGSKGVFWTDIRFILPKIAEWPNSGWESLPTVKTQAGGGRNNPYVVDCPAPAFHMWWNVLCPDEQDTPSAPHMSWSAQLGSAVAGRN